MMYQCYRSNVDRPSSRVYAAASRISCRISACASSSETVVVATAASCTAAAAAFLLASGLPSRNGVGWSDSVRAE